MTLTDEINAIKNVTGDKLPHVIDVLAKIAARLPEPVKAEPKVRWFRAPNADHCHCFVKDSYGYGVTTSSPDLLGTKFGASELLDMGYVEVPGPLKFVDPAVDELAKAEPTGVAALHGAIPAEESDAEFLAQVAEENAKGKPGPAGRTIADMAKDVVESNVRGLNNPTEPVVFCGYSIKAIPGLTETQSLNTYRERAAYLAASVARAAIDELVRRYETWVGKAPPLLRHFAAEMKGEK